MYTIICSHVCFGRSNPVATDRIVTETCCATLQYMRWEESTKSVSSETDIIENKILIQQIIPCFMFLWPCIVSKAWGKKTNKMQQYRCFIVNSGCWLLKLSQHVSGIFMPIFRRKTTCYSMWSVFAGSVGCGRLRYRNLPHPTLPANTLHML